MSQPETKPFDYLIHNVNIASMATHGDYGIIENACLGVKSGVIEFIGTQEQLNAANELESNAETVINAHNQWLTPGLIDCHTHLVYGGNRANEFEMRLNGASYEDIAKAGGGILSSVRATRAATEQQLFETASKRLKSLLKEGLTTIEIKSGYGLDTETEIKMLKVARRLSKEFPVRVSTTFLGAHALPPEYKDRADDYIDLVCNEMLPTIAELELADAVDAFCENIGFSYQQTQKVFETAKQLGLPVKLHAEQLSDQSGAGLAADFDALSADHLEYLSQESIEKMAKSGTVAVLLPGAFTF